MREPVCNCVREKEESRAEAEHRLAPADRQFRFVVETRNFSIVYPRFISISSTIAVALIKTHKLKK